MNCDTNLEPVWPSNGEFLDYLAGTPECQHTYLKVQEMVCLQVRDNSRPPWQLVQEILKRTPKYEDYIKTLNQQEVIDLWGYVFNQLAPANEHLNLEIKMKNQAITHVTYVYGDNITEMSAEQLLKAIKRAKGEINELTQAGVESKYISKTITGINSAIDQMVEALDAL